MALGKEIRTARLNKRLTVSQVAEHTRIKSQLIEAIEAEDFKKIAAPIYAKGFIRLIANCVGLDPKPLVDEYVTMFAPNRPQAGFEPESFVVDKTGSVIRKGAALDIDAEETPPMEDISEARVVEKPPAQSELFPSGSDRDASAPAAGGNAWNDKTTTISREVRFLNAPVKYIALIAGVVIILILVISGAYKLLHRQSQRPTPAQAPAEQVPAPPSVVTNTEIRLAVEPPAPYAD